MRWNNLTCKHNFHLFLERVQLVVPRGQGLRHRRIAVCGARSPQRSGVLAQGLDQRQRVLPQKEDQRFDRQRTLRLCR